jgi:hypothetical protein
MRKTSRAASRCLLAVALMASACELFVKTGDLAGTPCTGAECDGGGTSGDARPTGNGAPGDAGGASTDDVTDGAASDGDGGPTFATCDGGSVGSDPLNCGACGHSCLGGACASGQCQPVMMVPFSPIGLLLDSPYIYIWDYGTIDRVPVDATYAPGVDSGVALIWQGGMDQLVADPTNLYWTTGGAPEQIATIGKDRSNPHIIVPTVGDSTRGSGVLAIKGNRLYWSEPREYDLDAAAGYVRSALVDGGGLITITAGGGPMGLAVDDASVYWGSETNPPGVIGQALLDGSVQDAAVTGVVYASTVAVDDGYVYYTQLPWGEVLRVARGSTLVEHFAKAPLGNIQQILLDQDDVYYVTSWYELPLLTYYGDIYRCSKATLCSAPTLIAGRLPNGAHIALDSKALYYATYGGKLDADGGTLAGGLMRLAK